MEICQQDLPFRPWSDPALARLPGLKPIAPGEWLQIDDAYRSQMAHRQEILSREGAKVMQTSPGAEPALAELLARVLEELSARGDFDVTRGLVTCPDGRMVEIGTPLPTLNQLVQEDFCILQKPEGSDEHVLTAALLCFPASWTLEEKFLRPLIGIHRPVAEYDEGLAKRVQRLFDHLRPDAPIWRANALIYDDPELYQPRSEAAPRARSSGSSRWLRSERQSLLRLEGSDAVVFSIHTYVVALSRFAASEIAGLQNVADLSS